MSNVEKNDWYLKRKITLTLFLPRGKQKNMYVFFLLLWCHDCFNVWLITDFSCVILCECTLFYCHTNKLRTFEHLNLRNQNSKLNNGKSLLFITQNLPSLTFYFHPYYRTVSWPYLFYDLPQALLLWSSHASRFAVLNLTWIVIWVYCICSQKQWGSQKGVKRAIHM